MSERPPRSAASDAFFPFADGLQVLIDAGVRAVVEPGGSIHDPEVVEAAQAAGITLYFTGDAALLSLDGLTACVKEWHV